MFLCRLNNSLFLLILSFCSHASTNLIKLHFSETKYIFFYESWYVTLRTAETFSLPPSKKVLVMVLSRWKINEIKADVGGNFKEKKLWKLKLFHYYNYYSIQRFNVSRFFLSKPHHIRYFPHIRKMVLSSFASVWELFHEFLIWNWFSWIFELSSEWTFPSLLLKVARKLANENNFSFILLYWKRRRKFFCFTWRPNNRWELKKKFNLYGCDGRKRDFNPTARLEVEKRSLERWKVMFEKEFNVLKHKWVCGFADKRYPQQWTSRWRTVLIISTFASSQPQKFQATFNNKKSGYDTYFILYHKFLMAT